MEKFKKIGLYQPEQFSRKYLKDLKNKDDLNIENIVFRPVGEYGYKFKLVVVNSLDMNVFGLTYINGSYYEKIYLK